MLKALSMRVVLSTVVMLATLVTGAVVAEAGDVHVRGYYRNDGTYVQPHVRSAPDGIKENNYSYGR